MEKEREEAENSNKRYQCADGYTVYTGKVISLNKDADWVETIDCPFHCLCC